MFLARRTRAIFAATRMAAPMSSGADAAAAPAAAPGPVQSAMRAKLLAALAPVAHLEIVNESFKHAVPPGSESHFKLLVVSALFEGKTLLQRHRLVNDIVSGGSGGLPVHALSITAKTPAQWAPAEAMHTTPGCRGGGTSGSSGAGGSSSSASTGV